MKKITAYRTIDGKVFDNLQEAEEHERFLDYRKLVTAYISNSELNNALVLLTTDKWKKGDFVDFLTVKIMEIQKDLAERKELIKVI